MIDSDTIKIPELQRFIGKTMEMVALQKGHFPRNNCKIKQYLNCGSPHGGSPLQKLVNPLNIGVGEGPCALPWKKSRDDLLVNQSKKLFLQWNHGNNSY